MIRFDGIISKWIRLCPVCHLECAHRTKRKCLEACNKNQKCRSCTQRKNWLNEYRRTCPRCNNQIVYKGKKQYVRSNNINSVCNSCSAKLRKMKELEQRGRIIVPNFNTNACKLFDEINRRLGWSGTHALNGGEVCINGFFLDYYEPTVNVAIEFDEPAHKYKKERDMVKENAIISKLECKFYRIDYSTNIEEFLNQITKEVVI